MLHFKEWLNEACNCWKGYKRKPGTKPCEEGSCVKEEAEQIDEISQKLAGNYYGAATKKHVEKVGVKPNMYDRIEKDMGKQRKAGVDRALDRVTGARKTNEETIIDEAAVDAKGYKSSTGGLTQKGRDAYNRKEGSNLKAPVTTPPSKLDPDSKAAKRRKSFCARMSGVDGPMKKPNGEPTRKALALRKWNC